ncbi:nitroreductase family protein [Bacillus sp. FJAT-22090]|uniref:nitroreductase family protein n=1 Tax=Bacillus sp. FJAT-22090 TaxID=1581038 RepID=UPI0011A3DF31|nr:nitroreductase family protein [Bacillus sp. FJAT-22090]
MPTERDSNLYSIMHARKSVRVYDPNFKISQKEIEEIITEATTAPSSSNLQAWKFLVIQDDQTKIELREIANNQEQVETSSAVIAVLGNAEMYKNVEQIYTQNVAEGYMDEATKDIMINNTNRTYPFAPLEARKNIATFDAGLIAMQLMLVAKEKGLDTVTMGGFDKVKFAERFDLPDHIFPIALIALGKAAAPAYGSSRLPVKDIVQFI